MRQEDGPRLLKMICSIKKFQRLRHEIEMKRATRVTRELHRDHLEHLYELIKEEKVDVGLDKEVRLFYSFIHNGYELAISVDNAYTFDNSVI